MTDKNSRKSTQKQFLLFSIYGTLNTAAMFAIYYLLLWCGMRYLYSYTISYAISVAIAFFTNLQLVFNETELCRRDKIAAFFKNTVSYLVVFGFGTIAMYVFVEVLAISDRLAPIVNLLITTPFTFFLIKLWAFKKKT